MASPPSTVYRDQLASLYHGLALWEPSPFKEIYDRVSIGDVGFVREGAFFRMFNVMLPWDHESNGKLGKPMQYEPLSCGPFPDNSLGKGEYCSQYVSRERNAGTNQAMTPDDAEGITYRCRGPGALLCLPHENHRKNIIHKKAFEDYIRDHVVSWFTWTQNKRLGVDRIEELILVSGCTLATSWAAAAFVDNTMDAEISLASRTIGDNGGASFSWRNMQGPVQHHNSPFDSDPQNPPTTPDQCVFIRGFRAKRILFWTRPLQAAAEPLPDDPDNRSDDEIQVTEVPGVPNYRDPLIGVLDYIVEVRPNRQ
ncbi:hypothetical protein F5888DRAFT_1701790 [Russula emetica]|nr:hypothetical protein F5888DRAFT_1701790 [Russula emetica]